MVFCDSCTFVEVEPNSMPCRECVNYSNYDEYKPKSVEVYKEQLISKIKDMGNITIQNLECSYFKGKKLVSLDEVLELIGEENE